jgi:hypothetical protein
MKIILLSLIASTFIYFQTSNEVEFAGKKIKVAAYYEIFNNGIESNQNSLYWWKFTDAMVSKGEYKKSLAEMNGNMNDIKDTARKVKLISFGDTLKGFRYMRKSNGVAVYNIIASGVVNKQQIIISYSSNFDPNSNSKFDPTIKKFIKLK